MKYGSKVAGLSQAAWVGVSQTTLWSEGTVSNCHLCPWLSLHTRHYITQQSGLQPRPTQWRGAGSAQWGVNSCPGNAAFQHQLLMCKACCWGLARAEHGNILAYFMRQKQTFNRTTASHNPAPPPPRPQPHCLYPPLWNQNALNLCVRAGRFILQGILPIKWTNDMFWSKSEFSMSQEMNGLSVECLKSNFMQSFRLVHPGSLGWALLWKVNTWDKWSTSWPNVMRQTSFSGLLSWFLCTDSLPLGIIAPQHYLVAPRAPFMLKQPTYLPQGGSSVCHHKGFVGKMQD